MDQLKEENSKLNKDIIQLKEDCVKKEKDLQEEADKLRLDLASVRTNLSEREKKLGDVSGQFEM